MVLNKTRCLVFETAGRWLAGSWLAAGLAEAACNSNVV